MRRSMAGILAALAMTAAFGATACAPSADSPTTDGESAGGSASAASIVWSIDADCAACHVDQARQADVGPYAVHEAQGLGCATCHDDEDGGLTAAHEGSLDAGKMPTRLKKTEVASDSCTASGCHDLGALVEATASLQDLADSEGTVVNPHEMMRDERHLPGGDANAALSYSSCHSMHGDEPALAAAKAECTSCHHTNVFECYTCHE